jgi:hypothetical protein
VELILAGLYGLMRNQWYRAVRVRKPPVAAHVRREPSIAAEADRHSQQR